ncbi:MAG: hypothetical protein RL689_1380 [Planctomycetota bacterium]
MPTQRADPTETPSAFDALGVLSGGVGETPTPPALAGHAFGVAHASTDAKPNREAIPVDSRGLRRFAATPGDAMHTTPTPRGSPWERT